MKRCFVMENNRNLIGKFFRNNWMIENREKSIHFIALIISFNKRLSQKSQND